MSGPRKKNIRTLRREAEAHFRAGKAIFADERLATEWFGSAMPPSRPPVLSDQNREHAFTFKKEIQPWVRLILEIHRHGAGRALDAEGTEKEILRRNTAGEPLPPAPFTKSSKPVPNANLRWLVGLAFGALARSDGTDDAESLTDLITRRFYSPLGLPEHGSEPLRDLLRPMEKRRRRRKTAEGAAQTTPPFTDKDAQRQPLPSEGDETLPLSPGDQPPIPQARPRSHRRPGRRK